MELEDRGAEARSAGFWRLTRLHAHPLGEIDLIMPIDPEAEFDGHGAGWLVYAAGSAHHPTVRKGRALVLYLLPQGQIQFTQGAAA